MARLVANARIGLEVRVCVEQQIAQIIMDARLDPRDAYIVGEATQRLHVNEFELREELTQSIPNAEARHDSILCRCSIFIYLHFVGDFLKNDYRSLDRKKELLTIICLFFCCLNKRYSAHITTLLLLGKSRISHNHRFYLFFI